MTRLEAASLIVNALENDYSCSVWSEGGHVRVYLTEVTYKSKGRRISRDNGYISIEKDGTINCDNLDRQRGAISTAIPTLAIEPVVEVAVPAAPASEAKDEDARQFEASEQAVASAELAREIG